MIAGMRTQPYRISALQPFSQQPVRFQGKTRQKEIVRLVLHGPPVPEAASRILLDQLGQWPQGLRGKYLITPGGFASAHAPRNWQGKTGWNSEVAGLKPWIAQAEQALPRVLTPEVRRAARGKVNFMTIAIDVFTGQKLKGPHAELVAVYDVNRGKVTGWTGKTYPVPAQESTLVAARDPDSHFFNLDGEKVMVLGCHDLNLFSPRAWANQKPGSERRKITGIMRDRARRFNPEVVLQHPHLTDSPNIWRPAWKSVERMFPRLKSWASAIHYHNFQRSPRQPLDRVLRLTADDGGKVLDLKVDTRAYAGDRFSPLGSLYERHAFEKP